MSDNLSPAQVRMARALLDVSREDVEAATGIAKQTLLRIENDAVKPRDETLKKLLDYFETHDIEFLKNDGIRRRAVDVSAYEGGDGFTRFYELVYSYLEEHGGTVYICGSTYAQFSKYRASTEAHRARMAAISKKHPNFRMKVLAEEGDTNRPNTDYYGYRWMPRKNFPPVAFYSFGDYKAEITFDVENPPLIILVKSASIAASYIKFFNFMWDNAQEVQKS
jgi:transcriptional regulator with XRE-family HTH domain